MGHSLHQFLLWAGSIFGMWQEGNVGYVTWETGPVHATEEFLVRNGKIAVQVIFIDGPPRPPAPPRPAQ